MAKLDKFPDPPRSQGRTAHDMSHDFKFTCSNGMILPVEHDILLPGDTAYLKFHFFGRNYLDFLAPAMADVDFHVDYFFVPMMMLYTPFGSWERGVNDEYSSHWLTTVGTNAELMINEIKLPLINSEASRYYFSAVRNYHYYPQMDQSVIPEGAPALIDSDIHIEAVGREYCRLMDMIGMNPYLHQNTGFNPNVFPYALLTYQCIWQKYFRLEDRENYVPYFNWDVLAGLPDLNLTSIAPFPTGRNQQFKQVMLANLYRLHYRPSNFDYFTSVKKSPLLNDQNLQNITFQQGEPSIVHGPSLYGDYASYPGVYDGYVHDNDSELFHDPGSFKNLFARQPISNEVGGLSQLRQLFAIDKVMQVSARARKSYDAQIYAHFGFKVPHDVKHDLTHIKHESATLHIGQVISTGDTESLGARAGVGMVTMESKGIKFTAPCHGVLMVTFSSSVRYDYQVPFLRKNFIQTRLDFWQPEFDHLGMQPVYLFETTFMGKETSAAYAFDADDCAFDVQGWTYRYAEKKRNINRITQAFGHDPYPSSDLPQTLASYVPWQRPFHGVTFGHYYDPDENQVKEGNYQYASDSMAFLSYPSDLDGMFSAIYDNSFPADLTNMADLYVRDQFIIASRIEYKKVSEMSTYSMPKLD